MARFAIDVTACWRPQRVGMLTVAVELSRALVEAGAKSKDRFVLLCSRERPASLEGLDCDAVLAPYRHEVALKSRWLPVIEPLLECDAILYPYWPSPPFRRAGAPPAANFVHDLAFRLRPSEVPWQQRLYLRTVLGPALRQAAAVLVPSETTRGDLLRLYPVPGLESRLEVVPEALPSAVAPGPLPDGIEPGFVLAVGTVEPRKNYPRLLAAYRQLRGRHGSLPFIINGRPGVPQLVIAGRAGWAYGDTLLRIQAEPGVRYLGHVDEPTLEALYQSASVLAFPSLYEGFGLPLLEAMAHGVPAVVGSTGALPELAAGAALAVDAEDSNAIAGALERLLAEQSLRDRLGEEGRRRAGGYTWTYAAERTLDVLRRISRASERKAA
ncbi:MAG TPA: glycosyltransferase family 1 protein [Candidatus Limnocylindrales bacterium]|nr:glycosyltransferase family 1 protein [Candidatus Limnocylindrales bacterium]